jgi:hypothetical protein
MDKDKFCHEHVDGCRLVSGGLVCTKECEWLQQQEPTDLKEAQREIRWILARAARVS